MIDLWNCRGALLGARPEFGKRKKVLLDADER